VQIELDLLTTTTAATTCAGDEVMQTKNQKVGSLPFEFIFLRRSPPLLLAVVCWIFCISDIYYFVYHIPICVCTV
jgi:hypothetical protein